MYFSYNKVLALLSLAASLVHATYHNNTVYLNNSVYFNVLLNVKDDATYAIYASGFFDIWKAYRGSILAISDNAKAVEGHWPYSRTIITSFPDEAAFNAWYYSPEYQQLVKYRHAASKGPAALLPGFVMPGL